MDFNDTPELAAFRSRAREWLEQHVPPRPVGTGALQLFAERHDEASHIALAREWQRRLAEAGWAGITWPEEHGGRGLTPLHQIVWAQEAADFDLPVDVFGIGLGMGGPTVITWGSEEQKQRWLEPMLRGDEIWCQLFSEPDAGSDVAGLRTRALRDGDEWIVNGQKVWTSGAHYSKWGMLLARTDPSVPKHAGLTYFIIDMEQPGVVVRPLRQMTGGANFTEVFFEDARVADSQILGSEGLGWNVAVTTLMYERLSIGQALIGAEGAFEAVLAMFDRQAARTERHPLADARLRERTVDVYIRGQVVRYMTLRLLTKLARGEVPTAEGAAAKLGLTALVERVAHLVIDAQEADGALAGADAVDGGDWALTFLSYPGLKIAGGTDEILKNLIGERVLGLPGEPRVDKDVPFAELHR